MTHDFEVEMQRKYGGMEQWSGPKGGEIDALYNSIIFSEALPPYPGFWNGKRIIDLSANNLKVDAGLAARFEEAIKLADIERLERPIEFISNDLAYLDEKGEETRLLTEAQKVASRQNGQLNNVRFGALISKDALNLTLADLNNQPVDLAIDRLGGLWYTAGEGPETVRAYLDIMRNLLTVGGALVIDDYHLRGHNAPQYSTGMRLYRLLKNYGGVENFVRDNGFEIGSFADWYRQDLNVKDETARIMVLRRLS